jgi:1,2-diacylglycerol 3-beta-galactosyltransferase
LYAALVKKGMDATICVVCGRNEKLKKKLEERDWDQVVEKLSAKDRNKRRRKSHFRRGSHHTQLSAFSPAHVPGKVKVVGLGFCDNMAEYMVAADILVTKAGPGTLAEAASVGLPVLMTSFLPGQEAGNVDFVLENGFGDYCDDPVEIAEEVSGWLQNPQTLVQLSEKAQAVGRPDAAEEIVRDIGSITHTWMALNGNA